MSGSEETMSDGFRLVHAKLVKILVILSIFCSIGLWTQAQQVRVWQDEIVLPTHEEGPPDINPPFDLFKRRAFSTYPYTTRENLTHKRTERTWRTLNLENEYLKVVVLPDLGGRLYSCVDKSNDTEMFYANSSIKFAQVAYRGAWVALGIEFNFPVSHNWMTVSPVDFGMVQHNDGAGSIWVGNIDRSYGMLWRVTLTLRPGKSLLEQTVNLYNHDFVRHRYYWWNTCSVESWDDSRIIYPMRYTASHGFTNVDTWPVDSAGFDLSLPKNHTRGFVSRFSHGSREPFMGVYHPRTEAGVVHFAFMDEVPGKKIWSWGWDERGRKWREALSDDHSSYLEVQAGLFRNQETYSFLEPQQLLQFREYYMPVRKIGGFSRANQEAVVHVRRDPAHSALRVGVNVNEELSEGLLRILQEDQRIMEETLSLKPSGFFDRLFSALTDKFPYTVELWNGNGQLLIAHTEGEYDLAADSEIKIGQQESYSFPPPSLRSEADFTELGKIDELNGKLLEAYILYREGIDLFPESLQLNKAAGRLAVQLKRYREATDLLSAARRRMDNDEEVLYYLGTAWWRLGKLDKACEAWESASIVPGFRVPAQLQLARLWSQRGNWKRALKIVEKLLEEAPYTIESVLLGTNDDALWHHLAGDPERVLEIVTEYTAMGFHVEAFELLARRYPDFDVYSEPGTALPQDYPLVAYYRGYCREKLGSPGGDDFEIASRQSARFVFPNRPETIQVLQSALKYNPEDATARLLLGALFLSGGQADMAIKEWNRARKINPHLPTLHRNLGFTQLIASSDPESALQTFKEGLEMDRGNLDIYLGIDQCMSLLDMAPDERVAVLKHYPNQEKMPAAVLLSLALALAKAGQFKEAENLFPGRDFIREEFGTSVHDVYMEVQLQKALSHARTKNCDAALAAIRNLGEPVPGLSFTTEGGDLFRNNARVQYCMGEILEACGRSADAREFRHRAAAAEGTTNLYYSYLAARRLGEDLSSNDWQERLESALERFTNYSGFNRGMALYAQGSLLLALDRKEKALETLREVFFLPDRGMSHYLTRELLRGTR